MPNGRNRLKRDMKRGTKRDPQNRSRVEPSDEERAARDVEIQQRGGYFHDKVKIDPFAPGYEWPATRDKAKKA